MTNIYDVLLKQQNYKPVIGYCGAAKYICIFYDEDKEKALSEMQKYVSKHGFVTPDGKYTVVDVVLREREPTGKVVSITSYHKLFNHITGKRKGARGNDQSKNRLIRLQTRSAEPTPES